jgi:hypothetical protein
MTIRDFQIIGKKFLVGVIVYLVPLVILATGLWGITILFKK